MRFVHGALSRIYRGAGRVACAVLLAMTLVLSAGCGGTSTTAPLSTRSCLSESVAAVSAKTPVSQTVCFWIPGIFIVGLLSSNGGLQQTTGGVLNNVIPVNVNHEINTLLQPSGMTARPLDGLPRDIPRSMTSTTPPELMVFDRPAGVADPEVAIASYQLVSGSENKTDMNNADLVKAVDAINQAISASQACIDVGVSASGSGGVSCSTSSTTTVWLAGATADLVAIGGPIQHGGGSPDGPPTSLNTATGPQPMWNQITPNQVGTSGSGQDIYVLDTALNASTQLCLTLKGTPIPQVSTPPDCDFLNLREDTFNLPNELIPEGYPNPSSLTSTHNTCYPPAGSPVPTDCTFMRHGEYVAKIIQHIAPKATLHLIGALNNYGAADVRSILYGLYQVMNDTSQNGSGIIVNLSLDIVPPTECLPAIWNTVRHEMPTQDTSESAVTQTTVLSTHGHESGSYPIVTYSTSNGSVACSSVDPAKLDPTISRLYVPIGLVMDQLNSAGYTLVAAAGNDSKRISTGTQPVQIYDADMPAAFCGVYAVAATNTGSGSPSKQPGAKGLAPFSNDPSIGTTNCMQAPVDFSASIPEVIGTPITSSPQQQSVYAPGNNVCSFYDDQTYTDDMGIWSGTSFATPLVSGFLADFNAASLPPTPSYAAEWQPCI
jgi:hypothetical protein